MRLLRNLALFLVFVFVVPALIHLGIWQLDESKPASWNTADWSSSGTLPTAKASDPAVIHLMAARTGRWKGGFALHSWIVTKAEGVANYNRYEVVGWGRPVRINAYAADGKWYSNTPRIIATIEGPQAAQLIPEVEKAVETYPFSHRGGYQVWPGPNSNSFVGHVLNEVPQLGFAPPAAAVGRNYLTGNQIFNLDPDWMDLQVNMFGYGGFAIGRRHGIELHFMGLVAGIDILNPAIKVPGFGRFSLF